MLNKKCSLPDCDITASSLLTSITSGSVNFQVCPKHIKAFGIRLQNRSKLDYRLVNEIKLVGSSCKMCTSQAEYLIETKHPHHNKTRLCHEHIISSFYDLLSEEVYQTLNAAHSEFALHRNPELVLI